MATVAKHEQMSRFLFNGDPQTDLHRLVDAGWPDGDLVTHMFRHTPLYGAMLGLQYGPKWAFAHAVHVALDSPLSPWQYRDVVSHLKSFGKGS